MIHHAADFHVGMFVESTDEFHSAGGEQFVGTVTGLTVNASGEPILVLHMIMRKFTTHKHMLDLGYTPVDHMHVDDTEDVFYEKTSPMHPCHVTKMKPNTKLK